MQKVIKYFGCPFQDRGVKMLVKDMKLNGDNVRVVCIQTAMSDDARFGLTLDRELHDVSPGELVIFDFSKVEKIEGKHVGLPLSHIHSLRLRGVKTLVVVNKVVEDYLNVRRSGLMQYFNLAEPEVLQALEVA